VEEAPNRLKMQGMMPLLNWRKQQYVKQAASRDQNILDPLFTIILASQIQLIGSKLLKTLIQLFPS
jgi:hypothetical protein